MHSPKTIARLYAAIQATRPLLRHIVASVDRGAAPLGITVGQRAILEGVLAHPAATAPDLARALDLKRQFVARVLAETITAGLIRTRPNPKHKRALLHDLTKEGRQAITAIRNGETEHLARIATAFTEEEIAAYHKVQTGLTAAFAALSKE